jgi:exodeoxyribonuclease-3
MKKIISFNANSIRSRLDHIKIILDKYDPDLLCLQELKCQNDEFPYENFSNYHVSLIGQKAYNGVAIISKNPIDKEFANKNIILSKDARILHIKQNDCHIINLYCPNGGQLFSDKFEFKLEFYNELYLYLLNLINNIKYNEKIILCGDFNIALSYLDLYNEEEFLNQVSYTKEEKELFYKILNLGFIDLYREKYRTKQEFTWFDYRGSAFNYNKGMRIDYVLATPNITAESVKFLYDIRSLDKASDHVPVLVELAINNTCSSI